MENLNKTFNEYKLILNPKLQKDFKRTYSIDEYNQNLFKIKRDCIEQYEDILHVYLSRKKITQIISIILLIFASLFMFQDKIIEFKIITAVSLLSFLFSIRWNHILKSYFRTYKMTIEIINLDIYTKYNINIDSK